MSVEGNICWFAADESRRGSVLQLETSNSPPSIPKVDVIFRWERLVDALRTKHDNFSFAKNINKILPKDILEIYEDIETSSGVTFSKSMKRKMFSEFSKASSCFKSSSQFDTLNRGEVDYLIRGALGIEIADYILRDLITSKLENSNSKDRFDFGLFVSLMSEVQKQKDRKFEVPIGLHLSFLELPIDPDSEGKQMWDMLVLILLIYCSFEVPYSIAFVYTEDSTSQLVNAEIVIDSLFLFDMLLSFLTAFDEKGFTVRDMQRISEHYLRTWFLPDLAGSFPFDRVIALVVEDQPGVGSTNLLRALRFVRLLRIIRAFKLMSKLSRMRQREGFEHLSGLIGIFTAGFLLLFVAHALGCIFAVLIGDGVSENWLHRYRPDLVDADNWVRYVTSLYWAMITITTTGYGDIIPVTPAERLCAIFVALAGAVTFSYCVGTISVLASQYSTVETRLQMRQRSVFEYLQFRDVSADSKRRVRGHYSVSYKGAPELFEEEGILRELSEPLRCEVLAAIGRGAAAQLPIFRGLDDECLGLIVSHLRPANFVPKQRIYTCGQRGRSMLVIIQGRVSLHMGGEEADRTSAASGRHRSSAGRSAPGRRRPSAAMSSPGCQRTAANSPGNKRTAGIRTITSGDVFGELGLFPDINDGLRPETAVAETWTAVLTLSTEALHDAIAPFYPHIFHRLRELCEWLVLEQRVALTERAGDYHMFSGGLQEANDWEGLSRLEMRATELKQELLRAVEIDVLKSAAEDDGSEVVRAFRLENGSNLNHHGGASGKLRWVGMSCVLNEFGKLLYINHDSEDLNLRSPRTLGILDKGRSTARALLSNELKMLGAPKVKELLGFELLLFEQSLIQCPVPANSTQDIGRYLMLCAVSRDDFEELRDSLRAWCTFLPSSRTEEDINKSDFAKLGRVHLVLEEQKDILVMGNGHSEVNLMTAQEKRRELEPIASSLTTNLYFSQGEFLENDMSIPPQALQKPFVGGECELNELRRKVREVRREGNLLRSLIAKLGSTSQELDRYQTDVQRDRAMHDTEQDGSYFGSEFVPKELLDDACKRVHDLVQEIVIVQSRECPGHCLDRKVDK